MEQINSKQDLINYFEKGCKKENQLGIGVEHEKFIFDNSTNQRANFKTISKIFNVLPQCLVDFPFYNPFQNNLLSLV